MGEAVMLECTGCGPMLVDMALVEVHRNHSTGFRLFAFVCPGCASLEVGACSERIGALLAAGARDLELRSTTAPTLTHDDLLDLHLWLATDPDWT